MVPKERIRPLSTSTRVVFDVGSRPYLMYFRRSMVFHAIEWHEGESIPNMIRNDLRGATHSKFEDPRFAKIMPILCACQRIYHTMYQSNLSYSLA
jgi:hypothetical protein